MVRTMSTDLRSWNWWRTPIKPDRNYGLTRLSAALAGAAPATIVFFFVWAIVRAVGFKVTTPGWPDYSAYAIVFGGLLCVPLAILSFGLDVHAHSQRAREASATRASEAVAQREAHTAELGRQADTVREALAQVYREHHDALASQAKELLQPDRYGQRDTVAAAREFGYFQDRVAAPALVRQGYAPALVQQAFELDREALIGRILKAVDRPK